MIAHSPLGGPRRAGASIGGPSAGRDRRRRTARRRPRSPSPGCSGSRRPSSRSPARGGPRRRGRPRAPRARLDAATSARPRARRADRRRVAAAQADAEVVVVMGIPGAGKTRVAEELRRPGLRPAQPRRARRHPARAGRRARRGAGVGRAAGRARQHVPLARVAELRDRGRGPARGRRRAASGSTRRSPRRRSTSSSGCSSASARSRRPRSCEPLARREPGVHAPTSQMRALRELEPPSADEGFAGVEQVPFERTRRAGRRAGVFVAAAALRRPAGSRRSRRRPERSSPGLRLEPGRHAGRARRVAARLSAEVSGPWRARVPAPRRPADLLVPPAAPGLPLAFARAHGVDPARSVLVGTSAAHRTLATTLGARYRSVG